MSISSLLTINDFERSASLLLDVHARDYYNGGSEEEVTLRNNRSAFDEYIIRPYVLRQPSPLSLSTAFLDHSLPHPIAIAPTAFHRMAHPEGEIATVKGAIGSKSLMISSSWATTSLEDTRKAANGHPMWFQLYVYKDRQLTMTIVRRAEKAGYSAIVLTVDTLILGRRLADTRNHFQLPAGLRFANFSSGQSQSDMPAPSSAASAFMNYVSGQIDDTLSWDDLSTLIQSTHLPVIVKGVLRGDDATEALKRGAKGIIVGDTVSNHGGRQIDSAPGTIQVLQEIVTAVKGKVPVFVDGGIRNGRDVFKAIALGAQGVFVGRPVLWGLTVKGEEGVRKVMDILVQELEYTMRLAGCCTIEDIRKSDKIVVHKSYFSRL